MYKTQTYKLYICIYPTLFLLNQISLAHISTDYKQD